MNSGIFSINNNVGIFPMCGDLLHPGHIKAIRDAKAQCNKLIICLNCKKEQEEKTLVQSVFERWYQLEALPEVSQIIPYESENDLTELIMLIPHQVRFVGSDYKNGEFTGQEYEKDKGVKIVYLDREHGLSTSGLKSRVKRLSE